MLLFLDFFFLPESDDSITEAPAKTKAKAPAKKPAASRAKKATEPKEPKEPKPKKVPAAAKPKKAAAAPKKSRKAMSDSDDDDIFAAGSDTTDVLDASDFEPKQRGARARKAVKYDFDSDDSS